MQWTGIPFELWGPGLPNQEIVGESYYVRNIEQVLREHGDGVSDEAQAPIYLLPEPTNPHDPNAVIAVGDGRRLGHLPREDAARYSRMLQHVVSSGFLPLTTGRVYYREYRYDGTRDEVGSVRVALDEPHRMFPMNRPPPDSHAVLPAGSAIQVSGEEEHMAVLTPLLHPEGSCWVFATVHAVTVERARSTRHLVEVRIGGERIASYRRR